MPHSSGGGSHSSGSHGGSGFSGSSSSGGSSARHIKDRDFPGARRYVYYYDCHPVYVYADYDIRKQSTAGKVFSIIASVFMMLMGVLFIALCYDKPTKLDADASYSSHISDYAGLIDYPDKVQEAIDAFYEETGIPVEIVTTYNEAWEGDYSELEDYAYDCYVAKFSDEDHWLIIYSQPSVPDAKFNDWYWEGMQGDNTDNIITADKADDFNELFQKYLTANSRYSLSSAIAKAFNETTPDIMSGNIEWILLLWGLITFVWSAYELYKTLATNKKEFRNAVRCSNDAQEDTCEYCGNVYVIGTCLQCPHCGAPLKPHTYEKKEPTGSQEI